MCIRDSLDVEDQGELVRLLVRQHPVDEQAARMEQHVDLAVALADVVDHCRHLVAIAQVQSTYLKANDLWVEIYALRELQYAKLMLQVTPTERPFFNPARRRATPPGRV